MKAYYVAEGAFYAASVFMLVLWEERRRDFGPMLLHHIATVALIAMSYLHSCAPSAFLHAVCSPTPSTGMQLPGSTRGGHRRNKGDIALAQIRS